MDVVSETGHAVYVQRMIENPLMTEGLVAGALEAGKPLPRWSEALVNLSSQIGGLARMKGLSDAQIAAAGRWRALHDRSLIGGARATDYSAVRVDTSPSGRDVVEDGAQARRELQIARRRLGPFAASMLDRIICDEQSVRDIARSDGSDGGSGRDRTTRRVLAALDELVVHFGNRRNAIRASGDRAGDWSIDPAGERGSEPD